MTLHKKESRIVFTVMLGQTIRDAKSLSVSAGKCQRGSVWLADWPGHSRPIANVGHQLACGVVWLAQHVRSQYPVAVPSPLTRATDSSLVIGRQGAPDAIQVADRFHLSTNASAALEEVLRSRRAECRWGCAASICVSDADQPREAVQFGGAGTPDCPLGKPSARELGVARMTVQRLLNTPCPSAADLPESRLLRASRPGGLSSPSLLPLSGVSPDSVAGGLLEHSATSPKK